MRVKGKRGTVGVNKRDALPFCDFSKGVKGARGMKMRVLSICPRK